MYVEDILDIMIWLDDKINPSSYDLHAKNILDIIIWLDDKINSSLYDLHLLLALQTDILHLLIFFKTKTGNMRG